MKKIKKKKKNETAAGRAHFLYNDCDRIKALLECVERRIVFLTGHGRLS